MNQLYKLHEEHSGQPQAVNSSNNTQGAKDEAHFCRTPVSSNVNKKLASLT